ncbi:MAG: hypothetical protein WAL12_00910 [Trebonia sp.]
MAYAPQAWRDFAVTTGGLAGALTGLLFVAVSLHSGALNRSRSLVTAVLVAVAGVSFLLKAGGGLYWMIPAVLAVLAGLVGGVTNAWLFLLKIPDD